MKNRILKNGKRMLAFTLTAGLLAPLAVPSKTQAAEGNTPKQEVVYTNLNLDGSVKEMYVVNIFDLEKDASLLDYGSYTEVRNMNTEDALTQDGDAVRAKAGKGKLYYEGSLNNRELPWIFSLTAELDGKACSLKELAGKSGHLDLKLQIKQNPNGNALFFDNYALQASFVLDSNKIQNLEAEDATIANVGANKQINYTILPGKEKDIEISVDVIDFEMQAISINGLPLSMDIEVDDEELKDRIRELQDAVVELDDGALELQDGVKELKDGVEDELQSGVNDLKDGADDLKSGAKDLKDGAYTVKSGVDSLKSGIDQVAEGLTQLNAQSQALTGGSASVAEALTGMNAVLFNLKDSSTEMKAALQAVAATDPTDAMGLQTLAGKYDSMDAAIQQLAAGMSTLAAQYTDSQQGLHAGIQAYTAGVASVLEGSQKVGAGAAQLQSGAGELNKGAGNLYDGTKELRDGVSDLNDGVDDLRNGVDELYDGTTEMKDGTTEMRDETSTLDTDVDDEIDEMLEKITGNLEEIPSFVSEKNTNIEAVQFVIQTEAVEIPEEEAKEEEEATPKSFWQKLLSLFGR